MDRNKSLPHSLSRLVPANLSPWQLPRFGVSRHAQQVLRQQKPDCCQDNPECAAHARLVPRRDLIKLAPWRVATWKRSATAKQIGRAAVGHDRTDIPLTATVGLLYLGYISIGMHCPIYCTETTLGNQEHGLSCTIFTTIIIQYLIQVQFPAYIYVYVSDSILMLFCIYNPLASAFSAVSTLSCPMHF